MHHIWEYSSSQQHLVSQSTPVCRGTLWNLAHWSSCREWVDSKPKLKITPLTMGKMEPELDLVLIKWLFRVFSRSSFNSSPQWYFQYYNHQNYSAWFCSVTAPFLTSVLTVGFRILWREQSWFERDYFRNSDIYH